MFFKVKTINKNIIKNFSKLPCAVAKMPRFIPNNKQVWQSTNSIRSRFIDFFTMEKHIFIEACSLNSKNVGSYFINSGVSQFREHILGYNNLFTGIEQAVNSQRCVRLGGKKCDLNDIGYDNTHLSYFEMLGNWSFSKYDKYHACQLMWKFLTEELELPSSHLYVTYFGGSERLGLPPDDETRDIWFKIGVKDSKILQFGEDHNFWEMGDSVKNSLCGPSTEIHWDYLATLTNENDPRCARCFVNSKSSEVVELWNCVFMEYKWSDCGLKLSKLPSLIIDTGMGLERLASVVQGVCGVYDTDSFKDIIDHLSELSKAPKYQGSFTLDLESPVSQRLGTISEENKFIDNHVRLDIAYRVISDHLRAICVCINDGILPGRQEKELKIRQLLQRAIRQSHFGLGMDGGLSNVIDSVCQSLHGYQNISPVVRDKLKIIVNKEETTFLPKLEVYEKSFNNFLGSRDQNMKELNDNEVQLLLSGKFGENIPLDMVRAMSRDAGLIFSDNISINTPKESAMITIDMSTHLSMLDLLKSKKIMITDNLPVYTYHYNNSTNLYDIPDIETEIVALIEMSADSKSCRDVNHIKDYPSLFGILTTTTNMYATKGGQDCDTGVILLKGYKESICIVKNVTMLDSGHIIHWCQLKDKAAKIEVADKVILQIDGYRRTGNSLHHTAHHIVFAALNKLLGRINQTSSSVKSDHAKMKFSLDINYGNIDNMLSKDLAENLESLCVDIIKKQIPVEIKDKIKFSQISQDPSVRYLKSDNLPSEVRIVSIGDATEICCGTHALNTSHLQDLIITSLKHTNQAQPEISFIVGERATEIRKNDLYLRNLCTKINEMTFDGRYEIDDIIRELNLALSSGDMSKVTRELVEHSVNTALKYKIEVPTISDILKYSLSSQKLKSYDVLTLKSNSFSIKKAVTTLLEHDVEIPVIIYDDRKILIFCSKQNLRDHFRESVSICLENSNCNISDIDIVVPKIRNVSHEILSQFISLNLPENFPQNEVFVSNLQKCIKECKL